MIRSSSQCAEIQSADSSIVLLTAIKSDSDQAAPDSTLLSSPVSDADRREKHSVSFSGKEKES